jgi:hypothetical protein
VGNSIVAYRLVQKVDLLHDPRVVYQDIQSAMAILDGRREREYILSNSYIAAESLDYGIFALESPESRLVTPTSNDLCSIGCESFDKRTAYSGIAAGYHGDAVAPHVAFSMFTSH